MLEHKNYHEAYGLKSDPPLNKEEGLPNALELDCDVDCIPEECNLVPNTAQVIPTVDKPESESKEELTEKNVLQVNLRKTIRVLMHTFARFVRHHLSFRRQNDWKLKTTAANIW